MRDKFEEIAEKALAEARKVACSREKYIEGLKGMAQEFADAYSMEKNFKA